MKHLSQRDTRWSKDKLGASTLTVGRYGCTTTAISMLSDYFGCHKSPLEMAHNVHNYTDSGLIIWSHLNLDKMRFVLREHGHNDMGLQKALKGINTAVILEVDHCHWVVAVRKNTFSQDYTIIDPWDGKKKNCFKTYKKITGAAYFEAKAIKEKPSEIDATFSKECANRDYPYFLQVENRGELWFIHPDGQREYLHPDNIIEFMKEHAEGITNADLNKIQVKK